MSAVSGQDGLVHLDSQYAGLFRTASLLGRRLCVEWGVWVVMLIAVGLVFVVLVGSSSSLAPVVVLNIPTTCTSVV